MGVYIIRRLFQGFLVLFLSTFVLYSVLIITPGGPRDQVAELIANSSGNRPVNAALLGALLKAYKLDSPYPINYLRWLFDPSDVTQVNENNDVVPKGIDLQIAGWHLRGSGVLTGDLGTSVQISKGHSVLKLMGDRMGNTLALTFSALLLSVLVAFPIGIISAIRQYSRLDYTVTTFSFIGISMPTFWLGLMLIIFLAVIPKHLHEAGLTWLPYLPTGYIADTDQENNIVNRMYHLVLPVAVLSLANIANFSRFIRASLLEVLRQDFVRTAWAKGLTQRTVVIKHALRNALLPVITIVTLSLPFLFSGAIGIETVFGYAGMGQLFVTSIFVLDIPLVMAFLLIITTMIILSNIIADMLYAVADPRIRYS